MTLSQRIVPFVHTNELRITKLGVSLFFFSFSFVSRRGVFERNESVWNDSEKKQTGKNGRCNFFVFFFFSFNEKATAIESVIGFRGYVFEVT